MRVSIGVFAYNEERNIADVIKDIAEQSLLAADAVNVAVYVLANGCTDNTEAQAERTVQSLPGSAAGRFQVCRVPFKGKSRTWNYFVHELPAGTADFFIFMDADIRLPEKDTLKNMLSAFAADEIRVVNSWPRKDLEFEQARLGLLEKLILKSGGNLTAYKTSICGQLYMTRAEAVRNVYMPVGLPVEDGFLRAMILTDLLTRDEDIRRITGSEQIYHVYQSIRTLGELLRHQTRIMIGTAVNEALFRFIRRQPATPGERTSLLQAASGQEGWLAAVIARELPRWPYGFVSFKLLTKRLRAIGSRGSRITPKSLSMMAVGFSFDFLVYLMASVKMLSGKGAGYW